MIAQLIPKDKQPTTLRTYVSRKPGREQLIRHDRFHILFAAHCFYELRHDSFHGNVREQTERNGRRDFPVGERMTTRTTNCAHLNLICRLEQAPNHLPTSDKDNLERRPGDDRNVIDPGKKISQL